MKATFSTLLSAEPAELDGGKPCAVLSFEMKDGKILDLAISLDDAKDGAVGLLGALAYFGNKKAQEICDREFSEN